MNLKRAIEKRESRRTYINMPVAPIILEKLQNAAWECNKSGKLNIQIITEDGEAFEQFKKSYGLLSGVKNYIALAGKKEDPNLDEKLGYFGESLVLLATSLGLGTCWVGGTYDKAKCKCELKDDEELKCVIAFGNTKEKNTVKENVIKKLAKRKTKDIKDMIVSSGNPPNWVIDAMKYVVMAPSAMNRQPVTFYYSEGLISAKVKDVSTLQLIDLGIAKLHFEIGASNGNWNFGNGSIFQQSDTE